MADPKSRLSVLVDPPLADPPPVADLEHRASALRRRSLAGRAALAAVAAVTLVAGAVALIPEDKPQTLQTAAPSGSGATAGRTEPAIPAGPPESVNVLILTFEVNGQPWRLLATRSPEPAICFTLQSEGGEEIKPGCLTPDDRPLQAGAADVGAASFLYGIVAPDVAAVSISTDGNAASLDLLAQGAGFPVNFIGTVVPPTVGSVELAALRNGERERVSVTMPAHLRVSSVNGRQEPSSGPATTVGSSRPPSTQPPTTLPPDTPVSTVVPPTTVPSTTPPTTAPPLTGQPQRVGVTPGATSLRKHQFESAVAFGARSVAVRFWNGVAPCSVLGRVDVSETAETVTITLWTGLGPGAENTSCIAIAAHYETIVELSAPLGARTVVDGAA